MIRDARLIPFRRHAGAPLDGMDASPLTAINQLSQSGLLPSLHLLVTREYGSLFESHHTIAARVDFT
jgi:hypothetical protein